MRDSIFGYSFDDILRAQQGGRLSRPVDTSRPLNHGVTERDRELLSEYGSVQALKDAGFFGAADRLERQS
jgi:hypothetical protein